MGPGSDEMEAEEKAAAKPPSPKKKPFGGQGGAMANILAQAAKDRVRARSASSSGAWSDDQSDDDASSPAAEAKPAEPEPAPAVATKPVEAEPAPVAKAKPRVASMFDSDSEPEVSKTVAGYYDEEDAESDRDDGDVAAAAPAASDPLTGPAPSEKPAEASPPKRDDSKVKNALAGMLAGEMNKKLGIAQKKKEPETAASEPAPAKALVHNNASRPIMRRKRRKQTKKKAAAPTTVEKAPEAPPQTEAPKPAEVPAPTAAPAQKKKPPFGAQGGAMAGILAQAAQERARTRSASSSGAWSDEEGEAKKPKASPPKTKEAQDPLSSGGGDLFGSDSDEGDPLASTTFKDRPKKEVRAERVDTDPLGGGLFDSGDDGEVSNTGESASAPVVSDPLGGGLFGDSDDDNDTGAEAPKPPAKESVSTDPLGGGIFRDSDDDKPGSKTVRAESDPLGGGLFGSDDDDLPAEKDSMAPAVKKAATASLFSDDEDDSPAPVASKSPKKANKSSGSLFGDDDDESDDELMSTNFGGGGGGLFDDSDDDAGGLFS